MRGIGWYYMYQATELTRQKRRFSCALTPGRQVQGLTAGVFLDSIVHLQRLELGRLPLRAREGRGSLGSVVRVDKVSALGRDYLSGQSAMMPILD